MQNKLQQLTEKLYNEGLSKGQQEADDLIAKAKEEALQIVDKARKDAKDILNAASKQATESKTNADTEIKMAARQVMDVVKRSIEDVVVTKSVSPANKAAFSDIDFVKDLIKIAITKFNPSKIDNFQLSVILPQDKEEEFKSFVEDKAIREMKDGIDMAFDKRFKAGFKIAPKGEGYYISFTEQDFENLFREFLRPKMTNLLFDDK
jgi:V/A-type H+-transporting ATPase subunit E